LRGFFFPERVNTWQLATENAQEKRRETGIKSNVRIDGGTTTGKDGKQIDEP
jgi:hypothetical protein